MMKQKSPLRLIGKTEIDVSREPREIGSAQSPGSPSKGERVAGKHLIGFLTALADSIDEDVKNILDL